MNVVSYGQILNMYFMGKFVDRLDVTCGRKTEVKTVFKNFYLEGQSCLKLRWEPKIADRVDLGGKTLTIGFYYVTFKMSSRQ